MASKRLHAWAMSARRPPAKGQGGVVKEEVRTDLTMRMSQSLAAQSAWPSLPLTMKAGIFGSFSPKRPIRKGSKASRSLKTTTTPAPASSAEATACAQLCTLWLERMERRDINTALFCFLVSWTYSSEPTAQPSSWKTFSLCAEAVCQGSGVEASPVSTSILSILRFHAAGTAEQVYLTVRSESLATACTVACSAKRLALVSKLAKVTKSGVLDPSLELGHASS
mmetsp:Transcript_96428/g.229639  ORF Transcript_96428/g.229639 Transcript_96428/m.229639 type:complete len:224 (-) Transcript_96428:126-797(-)